MLLNTQLNPIPFPFIHIDEQAHYSYTLYLLNQHRWWPNFAHFPMYDASTGAATDTLNYLNHPPSFYWVMKAVHLLFPYVQPIYYRLVPFLFCCAAMALYSLQGFRLSLPLSASFLYMLFPFLFLAHLQLGYYNNDALALLGGALCSYASLRWFQMDRPRYMFWLMLAGLGFASVKLTAFLLVGLYALSCVLLHRPAAKTIGRTAYLFAVACGLLFALPYIYLIYLTGSPAPNTPGQEAMVTSFATQAGWLTMPRMDFLPWLLHFLRMFAHQFSGAEPTFIPLLMLCSAMLWFLMRSNDILLLPQGQVMRNVTYATGIATLLTLALHIVFTWHRYVAYGWLLDSYDRYYFPLLGAYASVTAGAYAAMVATWKRNRHAT